VKDASKVAAQVAAVATKQVGPGWRHVVSLGPLFLIVVACAASVGWRHGWPWLQSVLLLNTGYLGAVLLSFFAVAGVLLAGGRSNQWGWFVYAAAVYVLAHLVYVLAPTAIGWRVQWNWPGGLLAFSGLVVLSATCRDFAPGTVGLTSALRPGWWRFVVGAAGLLLAVWAIRFLGRPLGWDLDGLMYQSVIPGMYEELVYRGILLAIVSRGLEDQPTPKWFARMNLPGVQLTLSALAVSTLFAATHLIGFGPAGELTLNWGNGMMIFAIGLFFWWVRAGTGSVWPAALAHNLYNVLLAGR
jgi:uncharacterized protein